MREQFCNRVAKAAVGLKCFRSYEPWLTERIQHRLFLFKRELVWTLEPLVRLEPT